MSPVNPVNPVSPVSPVSRLSLRARITVLFVGTVFGVGLLLIGLVYAYLSFTPVPFQATFPIDSPDQEGLVIDAAVPITQEILRVVLVASLTVLAALTALAGAVGWFVAGLVIRPLTGIADTARQVTAGDLTTRIPYDGPEDEIGDVTEALNVMLDSVQGAVDRQKRFAANASHELKTPIATIQAIADVALDEPDDAALRPALVRVREVNAKNAETVAALLQLAHLEPDFQEVDLAPLCGGVAAHHGVPAQLEPLRVSASATLIAQATDNLVRNAVLHGKPGTAALRLCKEGTDAVIEVENDGPVIERPSELAEPFARARTSRGHGLGLALVNAIAQAHGGSFELLARQPEDGGGLLARVRVPLSRT